MASLDVNNCEIFVICHIRSSNAIESFIRNQMYQLPISLFPYDDNETSSLLSKSKHLCSEILSPKRYKEKTLIATFDQSFSNIQQLEQIFEDYSIFHLNCSLISTEQAICREASVLETFQEIFLVHGCESEDELLGELLQNLKRFLNERCQVHLINARGHIEGLVFLKGMSELEGTVWDLTSSLMETQSSFRNVEMSANSTCLIITFNVDRKISNSIKCTFFQEKISHMTLNWPHEKNEKSLSRTTSSLNKQATEIFENAKILETYDVIILVLDECFNSRHFAQFEKFLPPIEECRRFFLISEEHNYDKQVSEDFQFLNLCEFCCYGNSTAASIIKAIPRLRTKIALLLAWNIEDSILATIKKLFTTYQIDTISEPRDLQRHHSQSYDHSILVIDGNGLKGLTDKIKEASVFIGAVNWLHIVCNKQSKNEIESVVMCCTSLILFHKITLNKEEKKQSSVVGKISCLQNCFNKTSLVLSWKVSEQFCFTFHKCTIRNLENPLEPLNQIFEEVIFICYGNFQEEVMTHSVQLYMKYVSNTAKVYLVSEKDCFDSFLRMIDTCSRSLQFSRKSCFFGETVADGINKIELSRKKQPNVFLLSFSIDKTTALQIDENFDLYTTKHVNTIPWSSRSLPFTGTEFEEVAIICGENIDINTRESLSVLYNVLSRATEKATIVCHETALSKLKVYYLYLQWIKFSKKSEAVIIWEKVSHLTLLENRMSFWKEQRESL